MLFRSLLPLFFNHPKGAFHEQNHCYSAGCGACRRRRATHRRRAPALRDNIEYEHLIIAKRLDRDRIDEILDLILETVCSKRKKILIAGDEYPAELVKAKFMKLDSSHIEFVLDCMQENTTKVRNIKQYLKAVLFNAPSTIGNYYTALVNHDMYGRNDF